MSRMKQVSETPIQRIPMEWSRSKHLALLAMKTERTSAKMSRDEISDTRLLTGNRQCHMLKSLP
jgi:hypothetical protein